MKPAFEASVGVNVSHGSVVTVTVPSESSEAWASGIESARALDHNRLTPAKATISAKVKAETILR